MALTIGGRVKQAWNAFFNEEKRESDPPNRQYTYGPGYSARPDRPRMRLGGERTMLASIITKLAIDIASLDIRHVRLDENERYVGDIPSGLNNCLSVEANIDQSSIAFKLDVAFSLLEKGVIAIIPVDTTGDPFMSSSYDILSMRVGEIIAWYPRHIGVRVYNDHTGEKKDLIVPKTIAAIVENPLYQVMNEPNSTLQRLIRKLNLLDANDDQLSSGKLDLIIQLPYVVKSETRANQAAQRLKEIEFQLKGSEHGIAYTDGTEKITQLNRPVENTLLPQIEYLTKQLYSQLGLTEEIFLGTAEEAAMLNYHNRTIAPIETAITQAMKRTFLTKTARTQLQSVEFFRDPFKLVAVADIAEIADKFTRNEIFSSNEVRAIMGYKPVPDAKADELRNKNIPVQDQPGGMEPDTEEDPDAEVEQGSSDIDAIFDELDAQIDSILGGSTEDDEEDV